MLALVHRSPSAVGQPRPGQRHRHEHQGSGRHGRQPRTAHAAPGPRLPGCPALTSGSCSASAARVSSDEASTPTARSGTSLDEYGGRPRLRTRAALATMRRGWVASHDSSAHEHGLEILNPPDPHVHITRPGFTGAWTKYGVKHHLARFGEDQVVEVDGLRCSTWRAPRWTSHASTARHTARSPAIRPCDWACSRAALEAAVEPMTTGRTSIRARAAVAFADPGAESVVETLGRLLVAALGVERRGDPVPGARWTTAACAGETSESAATSSRRTARCKYLPVDARRPGGASGHGGAVGGEEAGATAAPAGVWARRSIIFEDYWHPAATGSRRMREEYEDTVARFGARLPEHLAATPASCAADPAA